MSFELNKLRNIGISAHIDSGKTTLTERILYYTNRIHAMHEVRGKDGVGATMDSMELERERGITIASAATHTLWLDHRINIIDTPGHVDFTIEVERSLRVLDGAILVLCAVAGVQSQSITVDRQMRRYNVPRVAFVNKCDRVGANPARVADQLREKLRLNAVMMQIPIGLEADFEGIIDLVTMKAVYFDGPEGQSVRTEEIPEAHRLEAEARREVLLDTISAFSDELTEAILEEREVTEAMIRDAVRRGVLRLELCPVFVGSAYKNKGVQPLLDAVVHYLPCPSDVENLAVDAADEARTVAVSNKAEDPTLAYAFKLEDGPYGQLTYIRIYQGMLRKGEEIFNARTGRKVKIGRLGRMHADKMEDIEEAAAGDIVVLFGIDCATGDTFRSDDTELTLTSMYVPEPVIHLAVKPLDRKATDNMSKALQRFSKEDPTFRVQFDPKSGETVISGMGELHLDVYVERMKREYKAAVEVGAPKVAYRERITREVKFDYTHKKQTGGAGQYGRIIGTLALAEGEDFEFENRVTGGHVPREYIPSVEKGFRSILEAGLHIGAPVSGLRVVLEDGASHSVDSSDMAFQAAARGCFREFYAKGKPQTLEPIMNVSVEGPGEFQGEIVGTILQRRGVLIGTTEDEGFVRIEAEVPLAEMFGYATTLRSATQGKAEFSMEFRRYSPAPREVDEELVKQYQERRKAAAK
jgi:elongation factor G